MQHHVSHIEQYLGSLPGVEFYEKAVEIDPGIRERFLFFSGSSSAEHIEFLNRNRLRFLQKPAPIQDIMQAVHAILFRMPD